MARGGGMAETPGMVPYDRIEHKILIIRGQRVMLDENLAALYGVTTKRLNEQVKRNRERFPGDFMFQLNLQEVANLRSQFATSSWGGCPLSAPCLHGARGHHGRQRPQ
jgi:hypothetical protein